MKDVEFWQVKNFDRFQHYKDSKKKFHWIKLYHALPDDYEFARLSDKNKYLVIGLFLLAGRSNNKIINDPKYIRNALHLHSTPNLKPLVGIWIIPYTKPNKNLDKVYTKSSQSIANGYTKSPLELELELEKENPPCVPPLGEFQNVKLTQEHREKLINKFGEGKTADYIERLSAYIEQTGKKYKSHYATILNWSRRDGKGKSISTKYPKKKGDL